MPLKNNLIVKNNLIAIAIHICICLVFFIPVGYIWWWGDVWFDLVWDWGLMSVIFNWLAIGIFTIVSLFLYLGLGRKFLCRTNNMKTNIFSVIVLVIILAVAVLIAYDSNIWQPLLKLPFYPLGETISYFLQIKKQFVFLILSFLPSLMMLAGMMTKRKENHLP